MLTIRRHIPTTQNLGLNDRIIRGVITVLMIGMPPLYLMNGGTFDWHVYIMILGIYPALTAILGWDPVYALFHVRSCGKSPRNPCGTFPFEMHAAMGHNTTVDKDHEFDHSMASVHMHDTFRKGIMTIKTQYRLLTLITVLVTVAVIVYLTWLNK